MEKPMHQKLHTGDILVTQTGIPFIQHFGVVVVEGSTTCVYHCTPEKNVTLDTLTDFLKNRQLVTIRKTNANSHRIYRNLRDLKSKRYDVVSFNCIHFVDCLTA